MGSILIAMMLVSNSLTISPIGFSGHAAMKPATIVAKNKIGKDGAFAYNPMLSVLYRVSRWQFSGAYMRDCFDKNAGYLMTGPYWRVGKYFTLGASVGAFVRDEVKPYQVKHFDRSGNYNPRSANRENLPLGKMVAGVEVAPMALVTASAELPVTKKLGVEFNFATNVALSHLQVGFVWHFGGRK